MKLLRSTFLLLAFSLEGIGYSQARLNADIGIGLYDIDEVQIINQNGETYLLNCDLSEKTQHDGVLNLINRFTQNRFSAPLQNEELPFISDIDFLGDWENRPVLNCSDIQESEIFFNGESYAIVIEGDTYSSQCYDFFTNLGVDFRFATEVDEVFEPTGPECVNPIRVEKNFLHEGSGALFQATKQNQNIEPVRLNVKDMKVIGRGGCGLTVDTVANTIAGTPGINGCAVDLEAIDLNNNVVQFVVEAAAFENITDAEQGLMDSIPPSNNLDRIIFLDDMEKPIEPSEEGDEAEEDEKESIFTYEIDLAEETIPGVSNPIILKSDFQPESSPLCSSELNGTILTITYRYGELPANMVIDHCSFRFEAFQQGTSDKTRETLDLFILSSLYQKSTK